MAEDKLRVQSATPERLYVRVYKDFLATKHLTVEEKMVYIALKSFVDFRYDEGQVFPSMDTLCQLTSLSHPRATRTIKSLIKKGVVEKERRGLTKSNLYTLHDNPSMWESETVEEMHDAAEYKVPFSTHELLEELKRRGVVKEIKKEPASGTDQSTDASTPSNKLNMVLTTDDSTMDATGCQERYSMENIQELFDYSILVSDKRCSRRDLDSVMEILYDALNCQKQTIRVAGEDKPAMVVIGKLMRLTYEEIIYAIRMFNAQTTKIERPRAYMLTILYNAKEQMNLEINNRVQQDMYGQTDDAE